MLDAMKRRVDAVIDGALILSLAVILGALVLQVVMRYLVGRALVWPEELSQYLLVGLSFLGAYRAFDHRQHIALDLWPKGVLPGLERALRALGLLAVALVFGYVGWGGLGLALSAWDQPSTALRLPMGLVYAVIPIACTLICLALLGQWRAPDQAAPSEPRK